MRTLAALCALVPGVVCAQLVGVRWVDPTITKTTRAAVNPNGGWFIAQNPENGPVYVAKLQSLTSAGVEVYSKNFGVFANNSTIPYLYADSDGNAYATSKWINFDRYVIDHYRVEPDGTTRRLAFGSQPTSWGYAERPSYLDSTGTFHGAVNGYDSTDIIVNSSLRVINLAPPMFFAVDASGNYYFPGPLSNPGLRKYSPTGTLLWQSPYSTLEVVIVPGRIVLPGYDDPTSVTRVLDEGGNLVSTIPGGRPAISPSGRVLTGQNFEISPGVWVQRYFLHKLDGTHLWTKDFGGMSAASGASFGADQWDNFYIQFRHQTPTRVSRYVKLDVTGNIVWDISLNIGVWSVLPKFNTVTGDILTAEYGASLKVLHQAPVGMPDSFTTAPGVTLNGSVKGNDRYIDGATFSVVGRTPNGYLTFNPNGTFTYMPNPGSARSDTFSYRITKPGLTPTAPIPVTITIQ